MSGHGCPYPIRHPIWWCPHPLWRLGSIWGALLVWMFWGAVLAVPQVIYALTQNVVWALVGQGIGLIPGMLLLWMLEAWHWPFLRQERNGPVQLVPFASLLWLLRKG
jgi:hypothetical protein